MVNSNQPFFIIQSHRVHGMSLVYLPTNLRNTHEPLGIHICISPQSRGVIRELITVCINKEWGVRFQVHVLPGDFVDHRLVHLGTAGLLPVVQGVCQMFD